VRRLLLVLAVAGLLLAARPAAAQAPGSGPTTSDYDTAQCVSALPKPGCGTKPTSSGDRGGWAQVALFVVMTAGMAGIGIVVAVSTHRHTLARAARPG
jgi:hypothetical protein